MYKYAVFDIKLAYNHYFFIPFVQIHLPTISLGRRVVGVQTSDWGAVAPLASP